MKQRIISALVGLAILIVVLFFYNSIMLNLVIVTICLLAVYEALLATKYLANKALVTSCFLFVTIICFGKELILLKILPLLCYVFVLSLFIIILSNHNTMHIEQIAFSFFICAIIAFSFLTSLMLRDVYREVIGIYYTLLALGSAWLSDTGAYFTGRAFGKHKLAPGISPKKTVEGAIGGVIFATLSLLLVSTIYSLAWAQQGYTIHINYYLLMIVVPVCSVVGILGDLSFSIIKRQCNVKDFGSIMPGHGGILDRFDSVIFVLPLVYIITSFLPIAVIV